MGDPRFFHAGFFGGARAVRPAWAQTENPGCTYTAHTRGYADLNFELPFSKGGFAIFRPFALHRCGEERFQAILGATPPNNQQFVGCQPTAEVWWLELHYHNRRLQSVTSSASIPASVRSRFGVIFFLFRYSLRYHQHHEDGYSGIMALRRGRGEGRPSWDSV